MEELGAGVAFMDALSREEVLAHLREQQRSSAEVRDSLLAMVPQFPARQETPHAPDLLELWSGVFDNLTGAEYTLNNVTFTVVPAPAAAAVIGFGGLLAARRRR